jgi:hypothetical protein
MATNHPHDPGSFGGYPVDPNPFGGNPFDYSPFDGGVEGPFPHGSPRPIGHDQVNTLATLSLVFAFVFAPAGAILGHLGLSQIARNGQRGRERALVGATLSYVFLTAAVVAVVVWATLGGTTPGSVTTAAPASTATVTPPVSTQTTTATTTPVPPPQPTVTPADLAGLLPSLEEIKVLTGNSDLTLPATATDLVGEAPGQSVDPPECWAAYAPARRPVYDAAAVRGVYLTQYESTILGPTQSVAAYDDAGAAQSALRSILADWVQCAAGEMRYTDTDYGGGRVASLAVSPPADAGNGITTISVVAKRELRGAIYRAIAAKSNIVVDVDVAAGSEPDRTAVAVAIANAILDKIPG